MPFVIGGLAATLFIAADLKIIRGFRAPPFAWHWWGLRLLIEAAVGALAVVLVKVAALKVSGIDGPASWAIVGMIAPRIVGEVHVGDASGPDRFAIDLDELFDRIRVPLDKRIDAASAQVEVTAHERVVKRLGEARITPEKLADRLKAVALHRTTLDSKALDIAYLQDVLGYPISDEEKHRLLVDKSKELNAYRTAKRLSRGR